MITDNDLYSPLDAKAPKGKYKEILDLLQKGCTYREIEKKVHCSKQTIRDVINADELVQRRIEYDFNTALRKVRRLRKAGVAGLTPEKIIKVIMLRLQGSSLRQISTELNLATEALRTVIDWVVWGISQRIQESGIKIIHNPPSLKFVRFESRDVYPTDPPDLFIAISGIIGLDATAKDEKEFDILCDKLIFESNQKLRKYRIKMFKRRGSPFERKGRPFSIRIKRYT
ncbi:MAG: hypothetical protein ACTSXC_04620 [Candidatus Freyarchaeota archaeon]